MATTREEPRVEALAVAEDRPPRVERLVAAGLLIVTFVFALLAQTLLFHRSSAMGGDIEYHRGVAFTMTAGSWQGEGPIDGVISYFGGLYPFVIGWIARLSGASFDSVLSVVSWPFVLVLPLALWWLGRRIWPGTVLEPAVLAFLGTVGSSLALDDRAMWVNSVLPSGSNLWPIYPRDVALVLLVVALAIVLGRGERWRVVAAGAVAGVAICVHAQIGVYAVAVVAAYLVWRAWAPRAVKQCAVDLVILGGTAVVVSVWWWAPRLDVALDSRRLVLKSYPGLTSPDSSLAGVVVALGLVGLLALFGLVLGLRDRRPTARFAAAWLLVLAPLALLGSVVGDLGVITPRRMWFLAAVPLVICAAIAASACIRVAPVVVSIVLVAVVLVPSVSEAIQTRDLVTELWAQPPEGDQFAEAAWAPALKRLQDAMLDHGSVAVVAPDNDALYVWRHSGAQPFSFLPSGAVKLGFDPARTTDYGYLQRVRMSEDAFAVGRSGLCRLADRTDADFVVLRRDGDLLGTHDGRPSSRYRVDPRDRTTETVNRPVGPGLRYFDKSSTEILQVAPSKALPLGWSDPDVRRLDVYQDRIRPVPPLTLVLPDGRRIVPRLERAGRSLILQFSTPEGIPPGTALVVNHRGRARISRIIGYEPASGLPAPERGVVVLDPTTLC
jgi:hypothetical protein